MRTYLVAFGLSLVMSLVLTPLARDLALRRGWADAGGGRKIHRGTVPRLGGVAVAISALLPVALLLLWDNRISRALHDDGPLLVGLLVGGGIIGLVGILDDLRGLPAWVKLAGQVAAAGVVYAAGIRIEALSVPFFQPVHVGWLSLPLTLFWIVLVVNAINLIDGLDGLAGGVVVLGGGTLFVMSVVEDNKLAALLLSVAVGATVGFLRYNAHRATIFLGDTGSLWLGFVLALVSVHSSQKSYTLFSIVAALLALGLPVFDLSLAVVRRFLSGRPLFQPDQHHVHHLLLRRGLSPRQSLLLMIGAAVVLEGVALLFIYANDAISALAIVALVPLVVVSVRLLDLPGIIRDARRAGALEDARAELERRSRALSELRGALRGADAPEAVFAAVVAAARPLGFERVVLRLPGRAPLRWDDAGVSDEVHHESLVVEERLLAAGEHELGRLELAWWGDREPVVGFMRIVAESIADGTALALLAQRAARLPAVSGE